MPRYDYECAACGHEHEQFHRMDDTALPCPRCGSKRVSKMLCCPAVKPPPDAGWELENNGRGRYISQLQKEPGPAGSEKDAFCRSQSEAIEKAKRRGFKVTRER